MAKTYQIFLIIASIIRGNSTHLSCPQRIESVVQGLTTGGKCYHCNPHDRSCWQWHPPPPSHSELWGTDLGYLWKYETEFEVMTVTWVDYCSGLVVTLSLFFFYWITLICNSDVTPFKVNVLSSYSNYINVFIISH